MHFIRIDFSFRIFFARVVLSSQNISFLSFSFAAKPFSLALSRGQLDVAARALDRADRAAELFAVHGADRAALAFERARLQHARGDVESALQQARRSLLQLCLEWPSTEKDVVQFLHQFHWERATW